MNNRGMNADSHEFSTTAESITITEIPPSIFISEAVFLSVAFVLAVVLFVRSRSMANGILIASICCIMLDQVPYALGEIPLFQSSHAYFSFVSVLQNWAGRFKCIGAFLLMVYLAFKLLAVKNART
ncbi:hypothetical protein [Prosthecobacter sp.]|uniref:hypothetical protein n=1 Tax=Prosthecobacter sp. TaxID=1965333 RepID=UPI002AB7F3EE|nr:hypothetical protein [Prosthecobacter sp.]MDZ4406304.1 hypothetical protein [Prosthecobacter sp.]